MEGNIEHRLTEVEERVKSNTKSISELEKRQDDLDELVSTVKVLAVREENVEIDVKEIMCDLKSLTNKPAKLWYDFVVKVIWLVAAAVIGFALAHIGL